MTRARLDHILLIKLQDVEYLEAMLSATFWRTEAMSVRNPMMTTQDCGIVESL